MIKILPPRFRHGGVVGDAVEGFATGLVLRVAILFILEEGCSGGGGGGFGAVAGCYG